MTQIIAYLERARLLPLDSERVERVHQRNGILFGDLFHYVERVVEVPVSVVTPQDIEAIDIAVATIQTITASARKAIERVAVGEYPFGTKQPVKPTKRVKLVVPVHERPSLTLGGVPTNGANGVKIKKGARKMLAVLASQVRGITKLQLGTLTGMRHTGGTFGDYLGTLRRNGLVLVHAGAISITPDGREFIGDAALAVPTTTEEVLALWRPKFKAGARKILDLLVKAFPAALDKPQIGTAVGNEYTGGTFNDYLGTLVRSGVVIKIDGAYAASEDLFL